MINTNHVYKVRNKETLEYLDVTGFTPIWDSIGTICVKKTQAIALTDLIKRNDKTVSVEIVTYTIVEIMKENVI